MPMPGLLFAYFKSILREGAQNQNKLNLDFSIPGRHQGVFFTPVQVTHSGPFSFDPRSKTTTWPNEVRALRAETNDQIDSLLSWQVHMAAMEGADWRGPQPDACPFEGPRLS